MLCQVPLPSASVFDLVSCLCIKIKAVGKCLFLISWFIKPPPQHISVLPHLLSFIYRGRPPQLASKARVLGTVNSDFTPFFRNFNSTSGPSLQALRIQTNLFPSCLNPALHIPFFLHRLVPRICFFHPWLFPQSVPSPFSTALGTPIPKILQHLISP